VYWQFSVAPPSKSVNVYLAAGDSKSNGKLGVCALDIAVKNNTEKNKRNFSYLNIYGQRILYLIDL
jgi:hypothetical protein